MILRPIRILELFIIPFFLAAAPAVFAQTIQTYTVASTGDVGNFCSQAIVNGNPAISYYNATNQKIQYVRASNATGSLWGSPATMPVVVSAGQTSTLLVVGGNPAIAYFDAGNGGIQFNRATDATGSAWGPAIVIASSAVESGMPSQMALVGGRPAVCFYNTALNFLYARANDANGTSWQSAKFPPNSSSMFYASLADVNGFPAFAYRASGGGLATVRASNADGTAWASAGTINSTVTLGTSMAIVNGTPGIAFYDFTNKDLRYMHSQDVNGASWASAITLDSTGDVGAALSLSVVDGKPTIAYYDSTNKRLKLIRSVDANGDVWATPVVIDSSSDVGSSVSLTALGTNAAMSYYDSTNGNLKWSLYTPPPPVPDLKVYGFNPLGSAVLISNGDTTPGTSDGTSLGSTDVITGSFAASFAIENAGFSALSLTGSPPITITGPNAADFSISTQPGASLASGAAAGFQIQFDPGGPGLRTATVSIASSDPDEPAFSFAISGTGTGSTPSPEIAVSYNSVAVLYGIGSINTTNGTDFGTVPLANGNVTHVFTITNAGDAMLNLTGATRVTVTGANAADFMITAQPVSQLAPGESSTFQVTFDPAGTSTRLAQINIANDDGNESSYSFQVQGIASATGLAPEITVRGNSTIILNGDDVPSASDFTDFGSVNVASGTLARTFTIANLGGATLNISGTPKVAVSGANAADFTLTTQPAATVAAAGTTTFQITFDPSAPGYRTATLTIPNNDGDEPAYTFTIQGFGAGTTPAVLDSAFAVNGARFFSDSAYSLRAQDVAIASDGSIFVLAAARNSSTPGTRALVIKLSSAGVVDSTFGSRFITLSSNFVPRAIAIAADGSLRVAGDSGSNFVLVSLSSAGAITSTVLLPAGANAAVHAMTLQADGKALLLGSSAQLGIVGSTSFPTGFANLRLIRVTTAGVADSTFGTAGLVSVAQTGKSTVGHCLAIDASGAIVVAAASGTLDQARCKVVRFLGTGALDTSFDADGSVDLLNVGNPAGLAVQSDGKVALLCNRASGAGFAITRLTTTGAIDTTIGGTGLVEDSVGLTSDTPSGLAVRSADGRLFVGSTATDGISTDFNLLRLNPDGARDNAFDGDGSSTVSFGSGFDTVAGLKMQADGKILLFGSAQAAPLPAVTSLVVARFLPGSTQTNTAPVITTPPASLTVNQGTLATFSVSVTSAAALSYAWRKDGTPLSGQTGSTLSISAARATDEGSYTVVVTSANGSATSSGATLTVIAPPLIDGQPANVELPGGSNATFTVTASGRQPLTYRWQKNSADIDIVANPSAATATLNLLVDDANEGSYRVVVTNSEGSATSAAATLVSTANAPVITTHPQAQSLLANATITLSVTATGRAPFTFQWQKGSANAGSPVTQAGGSHTLTMPGQTTNAGVYRCLVTNAYGSATSNAATVAVYPSGSVVMTPADLLISDQEPVSLSVTLFHSTLSVLDYQWQRDTRNIGGAINQEFALAHGSFADAGTYRCVMGTPSAPVTSPNVRLSVVESAPRTVVAASGKPATITVKTIGTGLTYAWGTASGALSNGGRISGADKASLVISGATDTDAVDYYCTVSGYGQRKTTGAIKLVIESNKPVLAPVTFENTAVGRQMSVQLSATHSPTSFSAVGLPAGLAIDTATGLISGAPAAIGTFAIKLTAFNPNGPSNTLTVPLVVAGSISKIAGSYSGLVSQQGVGLLGTVTLTMQATGLYTGKVTLGQHDGKLYPGSFSGQLIETAIDPVVYESRSTSMKFPSVFEGADCHFKIVWDGAYFTATLSLDDGTSDSDPVADFHQNPWDAKKAPATPYIGYYTAFSGVAAQAPGCDGSGYSTFTIAANGTVTYVIKLPDGSALSLTSFIDETGNCSIHKWLSANKGSLGGSLQVISGSAPVYYDTRVDGTLYWTRPASFTKFDLSENTNDYLTGFYSRSIFITGARYLPPALGLTTGPLVFDDLPPTDNVRIALRSGLVDYDRGTKSVSTQTSQFIDCTLNSANKITVPAQGHGDLIQLKSLSISTKTGIISGTAVKLEWNYDPDTFLPTTLASSTTVSLQGVLARENASSPQSSGQGLFVISQPLSVSDASSTLTATTSALLSGRFYFAPVSFF